MRLVLALALATVIGCGTQPAPRPANPAPPPTAKQRDPELSRLKKESEEAKRQAAAAMRRAEEATRQVAELAAEQALKNLDEQANTISIKIASFRKAVAEFDSRAVEAMVDEGVDPRLNGTPKVKAFNERRDTLIETERARLLSEIAAARRVFVDVLDKKAVPDRIKTKALASADRVVAELEAEAKQPLPGVIPVYLEARRAFDAAVARVRAEKKARSENAIKVWKQYLKDLPTGMQNIAYRGETTKAQHLFLDIISLHLGKKLDKDSAEKVAKKYFVAGAPNRGQIRAIRTCLELAGDIRPEHDPDKPSLAEAFEVWSRLIDYPAREKYGLKRNIGN